MSTDNLPAVRFGVGEIQQMAQSVSRSGLFGMNETQLFTLMLLAQSKGLHPVAAVERYHVIQGRPAMKAEAMLADFQAQGGKVAWHRHDHEACEATFSAPGLAQPVKVAWTLPDAKRAGLTGKDMYTKYPRQMLRARVISEGIRMAMPGIILGVYTPEEVADFTNAPADTVMRTVAVSPDPLPAPNNNSGHGRGQYASPDQVEAYSEAIGRFVDAKNAAWLDEWTRDGEVTEGIADLIRVPQLTGHLLKWALRTGKLAPVDMTFDPESGKPTERVSTTKANKYVAIVYARERAALTEEAEEYALEQAQGAREAWHAKHDANADLETTEAGARG